VTRRGPNRRRSLPRSVVAERIGKQLCAARISADLTQAELAAAVGHSQSVIARWEGGHVDMSLGDFLTVCGAVSADPATVLYAAMMHRSSRDA
jgi:predicted transcriptional regulator